MDISLSRLYKTIAEVPGVLFTDKRRFFWSSENIHAEFVFKEHAYSVDPDPWEDGYWIVPKDKDATYPEIEEIRQHIETRLGCQQCVPPNGATAPLVRHNGGSGKQRGLRLGL